eukprot:10185814-Heterocapsa_arctica.AAC.1
METELRTFNTEGFSHKSRGQHPDPRNDQHETEDNEIMAVEEKQEDCDMGVEHMEGGDTMNGNYIWRTPVGGQNTEDETLGALIALGGAAIRV